MQDRGDGAGRVFIEVTEWLSDAIDCVPLDFETAISDLYQVKVKLIIVSCTFRGAARVETTTRGRENS
jgi:hypothetical protein